MLRRLKIKLWKVAAALEASLYPYDDRYEIEREREEEMCGRVDLGSDYQEEDGFDLHFSEESTHNWLKTLDDKVARLQSEMIWAQAAIKQLEKNG
tara:strand:- start:276 stop:560 length:285 start_codon:yes stop_codon:yes gene_type:complete